MSYRLVVGRVPAVTTPLRMASRIRSTMGRITAHLANSASDFVGDDVIGRGLRRWFFGWTGARIPRSCYVHGGIYLSNPANLRLGARCTINRSCYFDLGGPITLADDVVLGHGVTVITSVHRLGPSSRRAGRVESTQAVDIGRGAWIGANATVLPGVRIGSGAVVGAGAVVRSDVAPNTMVAGVPARVVRSLDNRAPDQPGSPGGPVEMVELPAGAGLPDGSAGWFRHILR